MQSKLGQYFDDFVAGNEGKSGATRLDIWTAFENAERATQNSVLIDDLVEVLRDRDLTIGSSWEAVGLTVKTLNLRSSELSSEIDQAIELNQHALLEKPFELFCAWDAFLQSGGYINSTMLQQRIAALKTKMPALWFKLALHVFDGNNKGIVEAGASLLNEHTTEIADVFDLHRELAESLIDYSMPRFISDLLQRIDSAEKMTGISLWAQVNLGIEIEKAARIGPTISPISHAKLSGNVIDISSYEKFENRRLPAREWRNMLELEEA